MAVALPAGAVPPLAPRHARALVARVQVVEPGVKRPPVAVDQRPVLLDVLEAARALGHGVDVDQGLVEVRVERCVAGAVDEQGYVGSLLAPLGLLERVAADLAVLDLLGVRERNAHAI